MKKSNKLLVQGDYPLIASPTLAQAYGVASAIFLQKLHYCLQSSEAKIVQQQKFFYHSYEQWVNTLGVYSISTIKRVVSKLKKAGILVVKKLAQNKWLQTNFYSINYRKLKQYLQVATDQPHSNELYIESPASTVTQTDNLSTLSQPLEKIKVSIGNYETYRKKATHIISEGFKYPLQPIAPVKALEQMTSNKRRLYHQLLQLKIDIHYDDARLDEWLKQSNFIIRKAAYLKDQLGHLKPLWYSPEKLGLDLNQL